MGLTIFLDNSNLEISDYMELAGIHDITVTIDQIDGVSFTGETEGLFEVEFLCCHCDATFKYYDSDDQEINDIVSLSYASEITCTIQ